MRTVSWKDRGGNPVEHSIYTIAEAVELRIDYLRDWRDDPRENDWILTDDDCIVQVIAQGEFKNKQRWIRTCTGTFQVHPKKRCDTDERENRYTLNGKKPAVHQRITERTREFARLYALGLPALKAYTQAFPTVAPKWAKKNVNVLLKKKEVQALVKAELKTALDRLGISDEYILKGFMSIFERDGATDTSKLSALTSLSKISGLMDQKKETNTSQVFLGIGADELRQLKAGEESEVVPVSSLEIAEEVEPEEMGGDIND